MDTKSITHKNEKLDFIKIKNFFSSKDTNRRIKKQAAGWEKIFGIHLSEKDFYSEYIKNFFKPIKK